MATTASRSQQIIEQAQRYIPGGVSSANRLVEPNLVFTRAQGAYLFDAEGRRYIDYHAAFGPPLLGHCHPEVQQRAAEAMASIDVVGVGSSELEAQLAQKICEHMPSAEKVLFCNSGSEATYAALRLARAVTGRQKIIKFQGCYHGWHDAVLMNVISPADKVGQPDPLSAGMLPQAIENTLVLPFNDLAAVEQVMQEQGSEIAAIILELIPHNIGTVLPHQEFVQGLRDLTSQHHAVLIFDEVVTGFRHGLGGYQKALGVTPDLTTMAKAIANGFPLAALVGRADLLDHCRPGGDVFFAGTFNAHPASVAASLATIEILERPDSYPHLFDLGTRMRDGLTAMVQRHGLRATVAGFGSVFLLYFMEPPIESYEDLLRNDAETFVTYRRALIKRGIYELPVNLKRNHISLAHTAADIDESLAAADAVLTSFS
ncbi:aspartate aminotransferase family protein [Dictyobacter kobayashii]|uniref:glutamate-1-semialdehyde 2,1-aminomutase n=1 Tax=Dictyobacter kobayashii TaxID=2014872 RepID=A0A402AST9_9CHLR|nr:glutamate-1-semialdehyde 2,1-aminomutase [Dictyobacter kobayashii]GCE22180.1 glutamate-1-semialdehyde 2,1-aminomutase [Dictyobacter kobayashii]